MERGRRRIRKTTTTTTKVIKVVNKNNNNDNNNNVLKKMKTIARKTKASSELIYIAICSRILLILSMFVFDLLISDYDTSVQFKKNDSNNMFCSSVESIAVWDAVHVFRIAQVNGYEYEHSRAFYPALPFTLRFISRLFVYTEDDDDDDGISICAIGVVGLVLNALFFVATVIIMEKLAFLILINRQREGEELDDDVDVLLTKKKSIARTCAILFCFNPATIFYIAPGYTETLFTFFATYGALQFSRGTAIAQKQEKNDCVRLYFFYKATSYFLFSMAACFRSNGILLSLYPACEMISILLRNKNYLSTSSRYVLIMSLHIVGGLMITIPTIYTQIDAYKSFCGKDSRYEINSSSMVGDDDDKEGRRPWCSEIPPNMYAFVQAKYWDVGFMKSWRIAQLPNIMIASPAIFASTYGLFKIFIQADGGFSSFRTTSVDYIAGNILWMVSLVLCATVTHIQISMRFLSTLSMPYICIARIGAIDGLERFSKKKRDAMVSTFFVSYALIGIVMFSNFYPWT